MYQNAESIAQVLNGRKTGTGWQAKCPAHEDRRASLSISQSPNGVVLLKCHAGCETRDILAKLDLTFADLQPESTRRTAMSAKPQIVSLYDYRDEKERLRYQVVRFEPKDFRQRRPDGAGGWIWNMNGIDPLPYKLPENLKAIGAGRSVFVVEGEKDADNLVRIGLPATCNHGGAGKWPEALTKHFTGADVVIIPDNDEPGAKHAQMVAARLARTARRIRILELPGLPDKGDVSDWISQGGTVDDLIVLAEAAPLYQPADDPNDMRRYLIHVADLKHLPKVSWLIPNEIPTAGLVAIFGPSGVGKSFFALDAAMKVAHSETVVYIAAEGELGFHVRTAAWAKHHKAELDQLKLYFFMNVVSLIDPDESGRFIEVIRDLGPKMVVVDTLALCLLPGDENSTRDMGLFVRASKVMQRTLGCAVVLVHHTSKQGQVERGNTSLRAACDVMIRLTESDTVITVECIKSKDLAPFAPRHVRLLPVEVPDGSSPVLIKAALVEQTKDDPLTINQVKILELLALEASSAGLTISEIVDVTGLHRNSIYRAMSRLLAFNYVEQDSKSYLISEKARQAMRNDTPVSHHDTSGEQSDDDATNQQNDTLSQNVTPDQTKNESSDLEGVTGVSSVSFSCFSCGGTEFWEAPNHQMLCVRCHPKPSSIRRVK